MSILDNPKIHRVTGIKFSGVGRFPLPTEGGVPFDHMRITFTGKNAYTGGGEAQCVIDVFGPIDTLRGLLNKAYLTWDSPAIPREPKPDVYIQRDDEGFWLRMKKPDGTLADIFLEPPKGTLAADVLEACVREDVRTSKEEANV